MTQAGDRLIGAANEAAERGLQLKDLQQLRANTLKENDKMLLGLALSGVPLMPGPVARPTLFLPLADYERVRALIAQEEENK